MSTGESSDVPLIIIGRYSPVLPLLPVRWKVDSRVGTHGALLNGTFIDELLITTGTTFPHSFEQSPLTGSRMEVGSEGTRRLTLKLVSILVNDGS